LLFMFKRKFDIKNTTKDLEDFCESTS